MEVKECDYCEEVKPIEEFIRCKKVKSGFLNICKVCSNIRQKEWKQSNKEKTREYSKKWREDNKRIIAVKHKKYVAKNSELIKNIQREWQKNNREKTRETTQSYYVLNAEKVKTRIKKYYEDNPDKANEVRQKYHNKIYQDYRVRLNSAISNGICAALKGNKQGLHWESFVGYTLQDLIIHLETQFTNDMNWGNYGRWHVDHITPKSFFKFDSSKDIEFKYCWSLDNLQPMWALENIIKSNKIKLQLVS